MAAAKTKTKKRKPKRRHKYCPICKEVLPMSVLREGEDTSDLWWLVCTECNSKFALTRPQYMKGKRPNISAIKKDDARRYLTNQIYSVGELIYHRKLDDIGVVVEKAAKPDSVNCSGSVIVSFSEIGQRTLIEGYAVA